MVRGIEKHLVETNVIVSFSEMHGYTLNYELFCLLICITVLKLCWNFRTIYAD
jgi:hypothetical protein